MKIRLSAPLSVIAALVSMHLFSAGEGLTAEAPGLPAPLDESTVVVRINGTEITRKELRVAVNNLLPLVTYHSSVSDRRMREIEKKALEQLIDEELLYAEAKRRKIRPGRREIKKEIKNLKKRLPRGRSLERLLEESDMTMNDLKDDIRRMLMVRRISEKKREAFGKKAEEIVTEEYMRKYYSENREKFFEPEKVRIREILIKADPGGGRKVWEQTRKTALEVEKRARAGEDFSDLAKEVSQDAYAEKGGDMGWAHLGSITPEFEAALVSMNEGDISGPVMTIFGYHIIKLEKRAPAHQKKFEDLNKERLRKELQEKEKKAMWEKWMKELRAAAKIEYVNTGN